MSLIICIRYSKSNISESLITDICPTDSIGKTSIKLVWHHDKNIHAESERKRDRKGRDGERDSEKRKEEKTL